MGKRSAATQRPWWLGGGATCGFCLQSYVLELEIRCVDCDRPMCPWCAATITERIELVCDECGAECDGREGDMER